jgi:hypothetical protein
MQVLIDGNSLFDRDARIESGPETEQVLEKSSPGLDGIVSISMGRRKRSLKQTGTLRALGRAGLENRKECIRALVGSGDHRIVSEQTSPLMNVRIDSVAFGAERFSGTGIVCEYTINYTQLL